MLCFYAFETVLTFFLVVFSVGVALGGLLNNRLLKGRIEAVYAPLAILGITFFSIDLYFASSRAPSEELLSLGAFLTTVSNIRVVFDIFMIAACGGLFVVPLNAIIQNETEERTRARVIAGSAIIDSVFLVASAVFAGVLIVAGWRIEEIFLAFSLFNFVVAIYICRLLPDYLVKSLMQGLFKLLYKVEIKGLENFEAAAR